MNLNHFLNAIVTALSVATVLITLMSFLIFKIRQFPKNNGEIREKIDGTFFRKYDPFRISVEIADGVKPVQVLEGRRLQVTAIGFFSAVSVAIFTAIVVQNVITDRAEAEKLLTAQAATVEKYNVNRNANLEIIATSSSPDSKFNPAPTQFQTAMPIVSSGHVQAGSTQAGPIQIGSAQAGPTQAGSIPTLREPASSETNGQTTDPANGPTRADTHARSTHKKKKHHRKIKHAAQGSESQN